MLRLEHVCVRWSLSVCVLGGGACVCVCRGVLCGGCNLSVHGFHHREVMCMAEATNDGCERENARREGEKVCARERSRHRENVFVQETPRKTTIYRWCM